ncbi:MAG: aldose 1-epimerase [Bryobacteraceae bacterium]
MHSCRIAAVFCAIASTAASAQNYSAAKVSDHGAEIIRLKDAARDVEVSIMPSIGNRAYEMKVHGQNILYFGSADAGDFQQNPKLNGIPFLAPWADLLNEPGFLANGKHYAFNMELGNVRGKMPIHGLLVNSPLWKVTDVAADASSAHVTSRLEFWKYPDLMAQWPFAHEYEMTYSLADGVLEVRTTVVNLSLESMPLIIGYHPFFQIPGIPRDEWTARIPARVHVIADEHNIPTGEMRALDIPNPFLLKGQRLDDGFTDFERDAAGRAHFSIEAGGKTVETLFGPKFNIATIWLPSDRDGQPRPFICFEPLTTIISGVNLPDKWTGLQTVPAGAKWTESFWIRSSGI